MKFRPAPSSAEALQDVFESDKEQTERRKNSTASIEHTTLLIEKFEPDEIR